MDRYLECAEKIYNLEKSRNKRLKYKEIEKFCKTKSEIFVRKLRLIVDIYHEIGYSIDELIRIKETLEVDLNKLRKKLKNEKATNGKTDILLQKIIDILQKQKIDLKPVRFEYDKNVTFEQDVVLLLSDFHIGEVVELKSPFGGYINKYDVEIAKRRLDSILKNVIRFVNLHRTDSIIDTIHICMLGDMVSGYNLHDDIDLTNELHIADQVLETSSILTNALLTLTQYFKNIKVYCVVGNHGRTQKKKLHKIPTSSYDYLAYKIMEKELEYLSKSRVIKSNVEVVVSDNSFHVTKIRNSTVLLTHGDNIKSWNSIPYYGMLRDYSSKQEVALSTLNIPVNYIVMGHFHQPITINKPLGGIIVNGSLKGIDEYAIDHNWVSIPSQTLFGISDQGKTFVYEVYPDPDVE